MKVFGELASESETDTKENTFTIFNVRPQLGLNSQISEDFFV